MTKHYITEMRNKVNGKRYIAKTVNPTKRDAHLKSGLRRGAYANSLIGKIPMQEEWDRYGEDAFIFSVLEECPASAARERKQWHMDNGGADYNQLKEARDYN